MKAELIIPFVDAAVTVGEQIAGVKPVRGTLTILHELVTVKPINYVFSISGDLEGIALFGFSRDSAMKFASKVLEKELMVFDQTVSETIVGLANQMSSSFVNTLSSQGHKIELTESALIRGMHLPVAMVGSRALVVPLEFEGIGMVKVIVSVRQRDVSLAA